MTITYTVPEQSEPKTGVIIKTYEPGKYLVREDHPVKNQPNTRFVFFDQIVEVK